MTDRSIRKMVQHFRFAIDKAKQDNLFYGDICFSRFPNGCCGDTCYLLAQYLQSKRINTVYVCGDYQGQSHAWLVIKDHRVKEPEPQFFDPPNEIRDILNVYSNNAYSAPIDVTHYTEQDIINGLIIDITADQFGYLPVFVDYIGAFHEQFDFEFAHDFNSLGSTRLKHLYSNIMEYID